MRRIRERSVEVLWVTDYYDWPRAGFCLYRGKPYYFRESDVEFHYLIFPLEEQVWAFHRDMNEDFKRHVGSHWQRDGGAVRPQEEWSKFYDKYKALDVPDPEGNPPLFEFVSGDDRGDRYRKMRRRSLRLEMIRERHEG